MGLSRRRTRLSNAVSPRGRIRPHVRTCFLTHYIRYYGIKTSDNLRVTSYCDSESLLKNEESFHRDVDSSSWYLKSDHDVIMKLSSVRKDYHLNSSHDTSRVTKTTSTNTTTSLDRSNSTCKPTTAPQTHSMNFLRLVITEFYPIPAPKLPVRQYRVSYQ
jgi:hypothetical protein